MQQLHERLTEVNQPIGDDTFMTYIRTSLINHPSIPSIITSINTSTHMNKTKVMLPVLMATLIEDTNSQEIEEEQKAENKAMVASWKAKGKGKGQSSKGANQEERMKKKCSNCKKSG